MRNQLYFIVLLMLISGCQPVTVQRVEGPVPVTLRVDDAAYWLEEWQRARDLPVEQLRLTVAKREQEYAKLPNVRSGLRLALLLMAGPPEVRDPPRGQRLLDSLELEAAPDSARALAALLQQIGEEQRRCSARLRQADAARSADRSRVEDLQRQLRELERQLQELTHIEQTIQQRN